jgi:hypothetical protein
MSSIRTRPAAVAALAVGCLGFAAATSNAIAVPHHHTTASKKHPSGPGFYLTNGKSAQKITSSSNPAAFVQDGDGNQHVVTTVKSASGDRGHIVYYTKRSDSNKWKVRTVPGLRPLAGSVEVQIGLSDGGRRIFAVFYECDGVFVADASTTTSRLPEPTLVQSADTCASPQPATNNPPIAHAFAETSYSSDLGILLPDPAQGGALAVWSGKPGGTFSPGPALPTADSFVPVQVTGDMYYSGQMIAVGYGSDGTTEGVYVSKRRFDSWSAPRRVATLGSPTDNYRIEALVSDRSTYIGLQRSSGKAGLFLVHGLRSGQWQGAIRIKHTSSKDTSLRLYINPATHHLHALFTRHGSKRQRGVMFIRRGEHGWQQPVLYTHSASDIAQQMAVVGKDKAVVGYLHH